MGSELDFSNAYLYSHEKLSNIKRVFVYAVAFVFETHCVN